MNPLFVVAGNLIVDDVVYESGTTNLAQPGGAALYTALGASLWDIPVGLASVVGGDYPEEVLGALVEKGIDLSGLRRVPGPGMRTWLLYEGRRRQVVHHLDTPSHEVMSPTFADLPSGWDPKAYHLAPMPRPIQSGWLDRLASRPDALLSLDPFELVQESSLPSLRSLFARADLVLLSEDELLLDSALERPERCLARLVERNTEASRLEQIFLKRGARGGTVYDRAGRGVEKWQPRASTVIEATGAGDAFAGGLLAGLLRNRPLDGALEQAVVSASFALEGRGPEGLLQATPKDCAARAREWFG
ncbi:MAG: carbohydrate kinase family protein [bacterium]|nr:carbohydrate kinase family protein [bacterium]